MISQGIREEVNMHGRLLRSKHHVMRENQALEKASMESEAGRSRHVLASATTQSTWIYFSTATDWHQMPQRRFAPSSGSLRAPHH